MINVLSVSQILIDMGILTVEESKKAMPFCISACSQISKRLKSDTFEDRLEVIMACAGIALHKYTLLTAAAPNDYSSFKAGDITVSKTPAAMIENAVKFRDEALANASPYLKDVDFVFEAVDI